MNNRIKELAKQAGIHFETDRQSRTHYVSTATLNQFAKSIVAECLSIAEAGNAVAVSDVIKQTFGVE